MSLFGDENKRRINLGGSSSGAAQSSFLLDQAKQRRDHRIEQKRRNDAAIRIQAQWRGTLSKKRIRGDLRQIFEADVTGIAGMRSLVLLGQDTEALRMWCMAMVAADWTVATMTATWIVLARQLGVRLLEAVANKHTNSLLFLQILDKLVKHPQSMQPVLAYLLPRAMYSQLATATLSYPKTSPNMSILVSLSTCAFSVFRVTSEEYLVAINDLVDHILTISLLPNRIPLVSLTHLSATLPLANLSLVQLSRPMSVEARVHLVSNLLTFTPPRYETLKGALPAYLRVLYTIMNTLPAGVLEPQTEKPPETTWASADSDDEDISVVVVSQFTKPVLLPKFDARTYKRLQTLPTVQHINKLITHAKQTPELIRFILALTAVWPSQRTVVLSVVSPGWMREIYRLDLRSSLLGMDQSDVLNPTHASQWPSMLLLVDAYTQMLLTMGDDEFFGTSANSKTRNPLGLSELAEWTKKLMNIAYVLYWPQQDGGWSSTSDVCPDVRVSCEAAREKITKCLNAIRTRDSRKSFVGPDHWHVLRDEDVAGFVDAAVFEDDTAATSEHETPAHRGTRKQIVDMSPRLAILNNIPFAIPFEIRVAMFRAFIAADRVRTGRPLFMYPEERQVVRIRRARVAEDGFNALEDKVDIKSAFQIEFEDRFGATEAGIDGGGVFKEFFTSICKEVFDTNRGLWLPNNQQELYPNPMAYAREQINVRWYQFLGKILGKAMYEGILVDVAFAPFFIAKLLGRQHVFDDLASLDEELYKGLLFLKHYEGDVADLALNFDLDIDEFGEKKTVELLPKGSSMAVTKENRLNYIWLVATYKLSRQIKIQSEAFFAGLGSVIAPRWLKMFSQQEVQILIGGVDTLIDFGDLRAHTKYGGAYDDNSETMTMFWQMVETFNQEERRALLRFATSCSRPPLLGFKELVPNFCIRSSGVDEMRLPTSSTCVNLLKLPMYRSPRVMREKLLSAIMSGAGFDLS